MADAKPTQGEVKPTEAVTGEKERGTIKWSAIYEGITGATAPGSHHVDIPGAAVDSVRAGHEPDKFDAKGIIMVPVIVVVTVAVTYGLITLLFGTLKPGQPNVAAVTSPAAEADAARPYNQRVQDVDSSKPDAKVMQPRLEFVRELDNPKGEPVYTRSFKPTDGPNNSPELYPQDLYPHRYIDHVTGKKPLAEAEWVDQGKGVARIPVADAIKAVVGKLPAKKGRPNGSFTDVPKISNGGVPAEAVKGDDHGHDERKPEPKKDEKH